MKKNLLIIFTILNAITYAQGLLTAEIKGGLAFSNKYELAGGTSTSGMSFKLGADFFYEATDTTEVGIGFAFKQNSAIDGSIYPEDANSSKKLFDSYPIYGVVKYKLPEFNNFRPYVKAYLGLSYNEVGSYPYLKTAKMGMYTGLGIGGEYNNTVFDLSWEVVDTELTFLNPGAGYKEEVKNCKNTTFSLTVGYKFELPWKL